MGTDKRIGKSAGDIDWKAFCSKAAQKTNIYIPQFFSPATEEEITDVEAFFGISIPNTLKTLLRQTNGIADKNSSQDYLVWNCRMLIQYNNAHSDYVRDTFGTDSIQYLFFADNGCGEHFGFSIHEGSIAAEEIGVYYPIENDFRIIAPDFKTWFGGWYNGELGT